MNRYKTIMAILVVLLVIMGGSAWYLFANNIGSGYAHADQYQAGNTEIASAVENLDIDWTSGAVNIEYHAGSGVKVTETSPNPLTEDQMLRWWLDGKTLRIRYLKPGINVNFNLKKDLTVSLPEDAVMKNAEISVTSADVNIPALTADEILLDSTSGNITAVLAAKKLSSTSTSGDMNLRLNGDPDSVSLSSTSGEIGITLAGAKNIEADSTSGNINVTVSGSVGNLRLHSTSGIVTADLADTDKADFSSTSGNITAKLASFRELKIDATSGDIALALPDAPGFTLDLGTKASRFHTDLALEKNGNIYTFGDGSAKCRISTTSGEVRIEQ